MGDFQPGPFGKYRLLELLGHGGMGMVYKAEQPELGRVVALKVLLGPGDADPRSVARFLAEARSAARLRHPAIVPIHEIGDVDGRHYFTMDWVDGTDLDRVLEGGPLAPRRAVEILRDAARAVQHAHENGIVHRDLKPGNILLDRDGRVLLTDFGLARDLSVDCARISITGEVMGTPGYMPPEQTRGEPVGPRGDVYALGAVLYHALTGGAPFQGGSMIDLLLASLTSDPTPPRAKNPDLHRDLETICLKALERAPGRRYGSAGELAEDCDRFLRGESIRARPPAWWEVAARRAARHRGPALAVAAAAALAAVGLSAWFLPRLREQQAELALRDELRPLEDAIRDARPFLYIAQADIGAKLDSVRAALAKLAAIGADPAKGPRASQAIDRALGLGWYFCGDPHRAEAALERALAGAPGDGAVRFTLARVFLERSIMEAFSEVGKVDPTRLAESRRLAERARALHQGPGAGWAGAEALDRRVAEGYALAVSRPGEELLALADAGLSEFQGVLGAEEFWILRALGTSGEERRKACDRALELRPHFPWASFLRGTVRAAAGDVEGAIGDYGNALRVAPGFAEAYVNRGTARGRLGDHAGAVEDFTEALRLDPRDTLALCNRSHHRRDLGLVELALEDANAAVAISPEYSRAYNSRALAFRKLRRDDEARSDFDSAIRLDPTFAEAWYNRARWKVDRRDLPGALADYDEAERCGMRDKDLHSNRGNVKNGLQDFAGAIRDYDEALRLAPDFAAGYHNRGSAKAQTGNLEGAISDFSEAIRLKPDFADAWLLRGLAHADAGQPQRGAEDVRQALTVARPGWSARASAEALLKQLEKR